MLSEGITGKISPSWKHRFEDRKRKRGFSRWWKGRFVNRRKRKTTPKKAGTLLSKAKKVPDSLPS
jgi:hypothetical protein